MMTYGWGMGYGFLGVLLMGAFWLVIVAAAIWLLGILFPRSRSTGLVGGTEPTALDILKQRYARGEISKEVFESTRRDIE